LGEGGDFCAFRAVDGNYEIGKVREERSWRRWMGFLWKESTQAVYLQY